MDLSAPSDLPAALRNRFEQVARKLSALPAGTLERRAQIAASAVEVTLASDFVLGTLARQSEELLERLADPAPLSAELLQSRFALEGLPEPRAMAVLRRVRHVEMARIAWRDLAGWADLQGGLAELSLLADCSIQCALAYAADQLEARFGRVRDASGRELPLLVLGMGKLGGGELNFSSDVDLVFLYPEAEPGPGRNELHEPYYRRLGQLLIRLLDQPTEDGVAFRVDTRLRPFGASGPLALSVPAFESYLARHGRDWERYAFIKARLITGAEHAADVFDEILVPFVYRRYIDFGVFDALRQMKRLIAGEVARRDLAENIKLGPGGIREIEFIVQAFQLVRGGRDPSLRERSLLAVLPRLAATRQLGDTAVAELDAAYRFLRLLENRLQAMDDQQTHDLPEEPEARARLAHAMGEAGWEALYAELCAHRARVEGHFARVAWDAQESHDDADAADALRCAWEAGSLADSLAASELSEKETVAELLAELRDGALYQRMDEVSRQRLAAVIGRIIPMLASHASPATTLRRLLPVLRSIGRRSAYLALLNENPNALDRLLEFAAQSDFIVRQIARHPLLLDELLDARIFEAPPTREELDQMLRHHLARADSSDIESMLEAMRLFQRTALFRIAVADRLGHLPLMKVSDRLTDTAELVLEFALETAWAELLAKYGTPMCGDPPALREAGFAIIGYGKLGGLELGYGSDLDLVFLHDSRGKHQETNGQLALDNARFYSRLAQRLIHFLSVQTSSGRLYEVDTRLRPSGRSGLMVASLESFRRYQRQEAWVWEHQALLRSRSVAGSARVRESFERERREILAHHVNRAALKEEIAKMRQRMRAELSLGKGGQFDIKQDPGGLADIEFLIDYWVLAHADRRPELVEFPDNVRQLEALERAGLVPADRCRRLKDAYLALRQRLHELGLDGGGRVVGDQEFRALRDWVSSLWEEVFG